MISDEKRDQSYNSKLKRRETKHFQAK